MVTNDSRYYFTREPTNAIELSSQQQPCIHRNLHLPNLKRMLQKKAA
jgi:hypothetical protein